MRLGRCFRISHSLLPLAAASALAACSGDASAFGEPFTLSASDAGADQANAGKSGANAGHAAAAGGGSKAALGGRGGSSSDDSDAGADAEAGDDSHHGGRGGNGGAGGTGGTAGRAAGSGGSGGSDAATVSFGDIFSGTIAAGCSCHNGGAGGLDLGTRAAAYKNLVSAASGSCSGEMRVVPGKPDASVLFHAVSHTALGSCTVPNMPQGGRMLTQAQLDQIEAWIAAGAPDN